MIRCYSVFGDHEEGEAEDHGECASMFSVAETIYFWKTPHTSADVDEVHTHLYKSAMHLGDLMGESNTGSYYEPWINRTFYYEEL